MGEQHQCQAIDPAGHITSYGYDQAGRLTSRTDAQNRTTTYFYDVLGRPVFKALPDGTTETFTYDVNGRLASALNPTIGYGYTYDLEAEWGQVLQTNILGKTTVSGLDF